MVASYPLLSQAPTQVEVELGCDKNLLSFVHFSSLYLDYLIIQMQVGFFNWGMIYRRSTLIFPRFVSVNILHLSSFDY